MVAYDGAEGAMLCVAIFVLGMLALHAALGAAFNQDFAARDVLLWSLIMAVAGAILAAYDRIVVGGVQASSVSIQPAVGNPELAVRLSRREQEVLQLVSEGYSNSMIAGRQIGRASWRARRM